MSFFLVLLGAFSSAACSNNNTSCQAVCSAQQSAGCGTTDCVANCERGRTDAARAGCSGQFNGLAACSQANACADLTMTCRTQIADTTACVVSFCGRNPGDALCQSGTRDSEPDVNP